MLDQGFELVFVEGFGGEIARRCQAYIGLSPVRQKLYDSLIQPQRSNLDVVRL